MWVCGYGCGLGVSVDGFNMDVLVRVHGCVSLPFPPFFLVFFCFILFFSRCVFVFFPSFFS